MRHQRIGLILLVLTVLGMATSANAQVNPTTLPADCYLFASFRGNGDGLHLAYSTDGLKWTALAGDRSFLTPTVGGKLMRDPCILQGPDGTFHLVWTSGWYEKVIGYASSKDLIHWSEQKAIPVMEHEPTAHNSWAPEVAYDSAWQQYIIFWATTIPGRFPAGETTGDRSGSVVLNHRIYYTITRDFQTFAPTKLLFDPGFSVIDATILKDDAKYVMIFKDETLTPPKKHLRVAFADNIEGPYTNLLEPFTPPGVWVEGPSIIKIGDYRYCYFDMYRDGKYGAMRTKDYKTWEDLTSQLSFSARDIRHGTAFKVGRDVVANLMNSGPIQPTTQP